MRGIQSHSRSHDAKIFDLRQYLKKTCWCHNQRILIVFFHKRSTEGCGKMASESNSIWRLEHPTYQFETTNNFFARLTDESLKGMVGICQLWTEDNKWDTIINLLQNVHISHFKVFLLFVNSLPKCWKLTKCQRGIFLKI